MHETAVHRPLLGKAYNNNKTYPNATGHFHQHIAAGWSDSVHESAAYENYCKTIGSMRSVKNVMPFNILIEATIKAPGTPNANE